MSAGTAAGAAGALALGPPVLAAETVALVTYSKQMRSGRVAAELRALAQTAEIGRTAREALALPPGSRAAAFLRRLEAHQLRVRARWQLKAQFYRWMEERTADLVLDVQRVVARPRGGGAQPHRGAAAADPPLEGVVGVSARLVADRPSSVVMYGLVSSRERDRHVPQPVFVSGLHMPSPSIWPQLPPSP